MTHFGSSTSLNRPSIRDHPIQLGRLHSLKTRRGGKDGVAAGRIFGQEMDIQETTAANISTQTGASLQRSFFMNLEFWDSVGRNR